MRGSVFEQVGGLRPKRNVFNLSYSKRFDADMGYIYPILCEECVPGDTWKVGFETLLRFYNPLVAPMMQQCDLFVNYYFCPTRLLFRDSDIPEGSTLSSDKLWENFLSQGIDGTDDSVALPRWVPSSGGYAAHSLWDYFGFPVGVVPDSDYCPISFSKRAYNLVYNNFFRDENLIDEVDLDSDVLQKAAWNKDYFTTALPWQQRGTSPSVPISITGNISGNAYVQYLSEAAKTDLANSIGYPSACPNVSADSSTVYPSTTYASDAGGGASVRKALYVDGSQFTGENLEAVGFDMKDLRLAGQIQKFMERNARGGVRYTEFLRSHFGVSPRDERLQIPEYLGGSRSPVVISEVLQTSATEGVGGTAKTPQGNLAGHGMLADGRFVATYHCQEFGYIIGLAFVRPKASYCQGIERQWLRRTRYDFYFPEFAHLSEQAIETAEIYTVDGDSTNGDIFGYQGRYNEMRHKRDMICGDLRNSKLSFWHQGRIFDSAPLLNQSFIECNPSKRPFAVQDGSTTMVINFGNLLKVARPIPAIAEPGYVDHF